jgi:hypothetical protein
MFTTPYEGEVYHEVSMLWDKMMIDDNKTYIAMVDGCDDMSKDVIKNPGPGDWKQYWNLARFRIPNSQNKVS